MNSKKLSNIFNNKILLSQIIFVTVVAGGILVFEQFFNGNLFSYDEGPRRNSATLLIDFNNMRRKFKGDVVEKMTVLDALNTSIATSNIELFFTVDSNNSTNVMEINDHIANKNRDFSFYVNSKKVDGKDISRTYIHPGDQITVKLE